VDGVVGCAEQCDDGNLANGDGCDQACVLEE
jgi:cysteine-rich repeat protein